MASHLHASLIPVSLRSCIGLRRCVGTVLAAALAVAAAPGVHAASATDAGTASATGAVVLDPMPTPPDILGYVEIPDVLRLIDRVEAISRKVSPMPLPPGFFRQQIGQFLGDPDFAHLDGARPLVFLATRPRVGTGAPGITLWVPTKDATPYVEKANQSFFVHAQVVDTEGVFSLDPDALDQAVADKDFYDALVAASATAPVTADLRWRAGLDRINLTWHDAWLDALPKLILPRPPEPGGFDPSPFLRAECYAGLAALSQAADLQVDVVLDADIIQVDAHIVGKSGSDLASAFSRPDHDAARVGSVLGKGDDTTAVSLVAAFNIIGWSKFTGDLLAAAGTEPSFSYLGSATVAAAVADIPKALDGTMAMRMGADGDYPLANTQVAGTVDPAAAKAMWASMITAMSSAHIGIISTIIPDVRTSHGIPVQRQHLAPDPAHAIFGSTDPNQQAMLAASLHDIELAFTPHFIVGAQVPAHVDALIAATQSATPLPEWSTAAATAIGPGQDGYVDYDLAAVMKASQKMMLSATAAKPAGPDFSGLPSGHPLMFAWQADGGADHVALRIPVQVFKDFSDAAAKNGRQHRNPQAPDQGEAPIDGGGADAMPGPDANATPATATGGAQMP